MKFLPSQLAFFLQGKTTRRNIRALLRFLLSLVALITAYSVIFHYLMEAEGKSHSWVTGFYWTLTVMSTLGFGDITFQTDIGRVFSMVVLFSGIMLLLVLLPFTFIQFFYAPWLDARTRAQAPRELPKGTARHVIVTCSDPVGMSLIDKLRGYQTPYALLVDDLHTALDLHDAGIRVVLGERDDPDTYLRLRVSDAALVFVNGEDEINTNIISTIRELDTEVPIVSLADSPDSVDIMTLAGSTRVLRLTEIIGNSLANRVIGGKVHANIIGAFDPLKIAEAPVNGTTLIGKTLRESALREQTGVTVVGIWERGVFHMPNIDARLGNATVLVLAGSEEQFDRYEQRFHRAGTDEAYVLILGGGRVGRSVAEALNLRDIPHSIVEKDPRVVRETSPYVVGSAADLETLETAGIGHATTVIITTQNDNTNIYLTVYCRRLRPDVHIVSRATLERNISTLHRAGADAVLSYSSLGSNTILNFLKADRVMMLAEGLDITRLPIPRRLDGSSLRTSGIRARTGCSVIALHTEDGTIVNPDPDIRLTSEMEMLLVGRIDAMNTFLSEYDITITGTPAAGQ